MVAAGVGREDVCFEVVGGNEGARVVVTTVVGGPAQLQKSVLQHSNPKDCAVLAVKSEQTELKNGK